MKRGESEGSRRGRRVHELSVRMGEKYWNLEIRRRYIRREGDLGVPIKGPKEVRINGRRTPEGAGKKDFTVGE